MERNKTIAVLYHKTCTDGFVAAWVARKKFGNKADFFPVEPREIPLEAYSYKTVYALDTSINESDLIKFRKKGIKTVVIDHHASSKENVEQADDFRFDNSHSGATLAWSYFFPDKKTPRFLSYVEDVDLWRFKLPNAKEFDAYGELVAFDDFQTLNTLIQKFENTETRKKIIRDGKILLVHQDKMVERLVENAEPVIFEKIKTFVVNSPLYNSFVGNEICKKSSPIAIIWFEKEGHRFVSLRSNGSIDVSLLAKKYGGGGHKCAAGFRIPVSVPLPWKRLKS